MINDEKKSSYFEAAMSSKEMEKGEALHAEVEIIRRIAMVAGLTKNSAELNAAYKTDPNIYWDTLEYSIRSYEHYVTVLELLSGATSRLYSIAKDIPEGRAKRDYNQLAERAAEIISNMNNEIEH